MRGTFDQLDEWLRLGAKAFVPVPGSELHMDDQDWPWMPISQLAHVGLQAAADHLDAVRLHLKSRKLFAVADLTLSRSALIGASAAVWLLAPDERTERLKRARTLASYAAKHHTQYLIALHRLSPDHEATKRVGEHAAMRKAELDAKRAALGERTKLDTTRMISDAAAAVFAADIAAEADLEWQSGSGAAHGLAWCLLGAPSTVQAGPVDNSGMTEFHASGSIGRIANSYMAAFHLCKHGWSLLKRRNSVADVLRTEG